MDKKGKMLVFGVFLLALILVASFAFAAPRAVKACRDGIDNDGDGYIDSADPGCANKNDASELNPAIECDDGSDNDGDSAVDYNDAGCSGPTDTDESNCGDSVCEGGETQGNCPADCGYADSCADSDGGITTDTFGWTYGYINNTNYTDYDYCYNIGSVVEYYCNGDYSVNTWRNCGTDTYGADYCYLGDVYADYTDYACLSGECDSTVTPTLQQECDYGCTAGVCDAPVDTCSDTDGGFMPWTYGWTYGAYNGTNYTSYDYCVDTSNVFEFYCSGGVSYGGSSFCGNDTDGTDYCYNGSVYYNFTDHGCNGGACDIDVSQIWVEDCDYGCTAGVCDEPVNEPPVLEDISWDATAGTITFTAFASDPNGNETIDWVNMSIITTSYTFSPYDTSAPYTWAFDSGNYTGNATIRAQAYDGEYVSNMRIEHLFIDNS
ncbi:MAG: hypothetical protein KKG59_04470 [Nanoarchaeota archaeon]|nr:hypothetical protein [Nanoarchaeota archaeon]